MQLPYLNVQHNLSYFIVLLFARTDTKIGLFFPPPESLPTSTSVIAAFRVGEVFCIKLILLIICVADPTGRSPLQWPNKFKNGGPAKGKYIEYGDRFVKRSLTADEYPKNATCDTFFFGGN